MSTWQIGMWWALMLAGLIGSAVYSGLETGAYSLNRVRLQILDHQGRRSARRLTRLIRNRVVLLSTLLIGNNVANYLGTAGLAVLLEQTGLSDLQVIVINVLVITPLLLVFGETLPKDLFSAHGDRLMYRFVGVLRLSRWVFTAVGILPLVTAFSHGLNRLLGSRGTIAHFHPRRQVRDLVLEGVGHGLLTDVQSAMVQHVLELTDRKVGNEMVAWKKVIKVRNTDPPSVLWRLADRTSFARFPVIDKSGQAVGMIRLRDALTYEPDACPPITDLMQPVTTVAGDTLWRDALTAMQSQRRAMMIVTRNDRPAGIVTIKDLIEPITGELASW